jgi:uncharacterized protein (DUF1501 family)
MGKNLKKQGFYNESPNLSDLDHGDLKHSIDFRSIYATVLDKWLGIDAKLILNKSFEKLDFI